MAILLVDHDSKFLLLTPIDTLQIHIHNPNPLLVLNLVGPSAAATNTGIIDCDIEAAERSGGFGDALLDLGSVAHVHVQGEDLDIGEALLQGGVGFFQGLEVDVGQGQLGDAMLCECDSRVLPNACVKKGSISK